jgi:hypothetical protein
MKHIFSTQSICVRAMDRVCSSVTLTDSNVISAVLSVRTTEISQLCCKCAAHF